MLSDHVYSSGGVNGSVNVHGAQTPPTGDTENITSPYVGS